MLPLIYYLAEKRDRKNGKNQQKNKSIDAGDSHRRSNGFLAAIPSTLASDHDTFNLTVKGYYIGLTVDRDSWNVNHGVPVELSST
jgi:hypothetical protein